ncbi:hypothetical protein BDV25DRAFT_169490 [Aspergillus avenaceus]|uniref:DUF7924 domain-containing protein n=1 Tax=Aspergillus avenaceus TaxID=36643 RepID=A0A5N6U3F3_ASPAV|nr:hypothetical protein BDV25DRAFT_169490 [Aspergillus avenaceus]
MKRSRSCSPTCSATKQHKLASSITCLTHDALEEHNHHTLSLPPYTLLQVASEQRAHNLSDIPIIPPPSTHSSQRSRSSSPAKPIFFYNLISSDNDHLHQVSERLWRKSKELEKKPSGEAEWTEALYAAINDVKPVGFEAVHNRDWRTDLKPPVHNPRPTIPRKRGQLHQLNTATDSLYPFPDPSYAIEPTIPVFRLKDPRPDICVGLSDNSLADSLEHTKGRDIAQSLLLNMQDTSTLISNPHVTPLGLRFPFLIVEAKAGATGGNLYQAQNQAAVGGSTALLILKSLSDLRDSQDSVEASNKSDPAIKLNLAFSVTTEGPVHELWLHFRKPNEDLQMVCIGLWRTTSKDGSLDLLRHLSAVLRWGNGEFKDNLVGILQDL